MKLLLDSSVFVFLIQRPDAILPKAIAALEDMANQRYLSLVTPWELQIKANLKKIELGKPIRDLVHFEVDREALELLPVTLAHVDALSNLPDYHRDPFDRMLIAQAMVEGMTLVTSDATIAKYPAPILWE